MLPLHDFQSAMTDYLTSPPGPDVPERLRQILVPGVTDANRRLAVHKNNVYARLVDALRDTFPVVERLVGEEFFRYAAVQYIAVTPPRSPTLLGYGKDFARFLEKFPPAQNIPYLSDVANLEFSYLEAYHAAGAIPVGNLGDIRDGDSLLLHPSSYLQTSAYQVSRIWEINCRDASVEDTVLPIQREYLLIIRPRRVVEVHRISPGAYAALTAFEEGATVAEARREAEWAEPNVVFFSLLAALTTYGAFTGITNKEHLK